MTDPNSPKCEICGEIMFASKSGTYCPNGHGGIRPRGNHPITVLSDDNSGSVASSCKRCGGSGEIKCEVCGGSGFSICECCGQDVDCEECDGEGFVDCQNCEGAHG